MQINQKIRNILNKYLHKNTLRKHISKGFTQNLKKNMYSLRFHLSLTLNNELADIN